MISKFNVLREYVVTYTTWGTRDDIKTYNVRAVNEINALMMFLFITATIFHLQQGLQVIIEDYVYKRLWINLNIIFCSSLFIVSIISLGKLVLVSVL